VSDDGRLLRSHEDVSVRAAVAGACLVDLSFRGRVDNDLNNMFVVDDTPTGEPHLDEALSLLGPKGATLSLNNAVGAAYNASPTMYQKAINRLIERKILEVREESFLWVMKSRRYPPISNLVQAEAKQKIFNILEGSGVPDPTEVALVTLAHDTNILSLFMSRKEIDRLLGRIGDLSKLDLTLQAARRVSAEIQVQIAMLITQI
jgi:hypothetical protein